MTQNQNKIEKEESHVWGIRSLPLFSLSGLIKYLTTGMCQDIELLR